MSAIVREVVYAHSSERVWRALTDPQELGAWLMPNDFVPTVGHKFQFNVGPRLGWRGIVDCEVLEVDPPRRLVYSWRGNTKNRVTTVVWTLAPTPDGGTRLKLEHTGFRGLGGALFKSMLGGGWGKKLLTTLPAVLDGRVIPQRR
jgi:uncharacterized protein YndB with AHSA1/START domain